MAADGTIKINTELDSSKAQSAMKKFSGTAKSALKGITIAAGTASAAITAMAGYAVKVGADFEAGMSKVSAISGATGSDLDRLTEKAKEMGGKTKFSATEAASAFEYMAMAGWKTEDMLDGIEGVMNLAAASGENLATTSDIVTDAITAFGLTAKDSGHFVDVLAKASSNSNTNVGMMGETFKYVAPVAGALGFSVDDCAVAIGLMANSGIKASQAGTTLRQIFTNLVKPTDAMQGAMDKLGISLTDSEGKTKSLDTLMGDLRRSFSGLTEAEKANYAATLAGQEGMSGFLAIVNASDADFEALKSSIANADGAAEDMAETMQDNLKGSLTILGSSLEGFAIKVYDRVKGPLKEAADTGTECVNRLSSAFDSGGLHGVVEEAGEIFGELADRVAESSDEAEKIVTPLRNVASAGSSLAKTGIKAAAKAFELLATNLDIAVPLLVSGVTAVKGYTVAKTAASVISKLSKAYTASAAALDLFIVANGTSAVATAASTGAITLKQIAVGVFTKQLGLATAAHAAFNAVVSANPIGLAVTAIAALTAGLITYAAVAEKGTEAEREHAKALKEEEEAYQAQKEQTEERIRSYKELCSAQDEQAAADLRQLQNTQDLYNELKNITDENGNVKAGEEDRAKFITSQLSEALGVEIEMTDNQIQNYQELQSEIQNLIQQKRIEAVLASQKAKYEEAVNQQMAAAAEAQERYASVTEVKNKVTEEEAKLSELMAERSKLVKSGKMDEAKSYGTLISMQEQEVEKARENADKKQALYDESVAALAGYTNDIQMYQELLEAAESGNADAIDEAIARITNGIKSATVATNEELQKQAQSVTDFEKFIREQVQSGTPGFTEDMLNQAQTATQAALEEFAKVAPQTAEELAKVPPEAVAALVAGDMRGLLSSEASGAVEGMLNEFNNLEPETQEAFANAIYGALNGLEGFDQVKDPAKEGAEAFLESLKLALDEHSPSKATEEIFRLAMEGAAQGVESGKENVLAKAGEFVTSFLGKFTESGIGAALQSLGSNVMSFFGIGVASQQGQSLIAGQGNAEAARTGAGSVDPTGTGARFGGMLGSGVAGTAGTLLQKGKGIADRAKTGAGSVDPTSTGGKFGTQYATGVVTQFLNSRGKGKGLADNAKSGAGSVDAYPAGSNFGSGFVRGIGAWISSAASKAVELASSAYNAAKRWLDEHSPSKKTKKLGKWFSQGMGIGIKSEGKMVEESAKSISQTALDALNLDTIDLDGLVEKLKYIDIPETMMRVNMAVENRHEAVADKVIRGHVVADRMNSLFQDNQHSFSLSDADAQKIGRIFAERAAPIMAKSLEKSGIRMEMYGEKVGSLISPSVDSNLAVASMKSRRYMR